MKKTVKTISIFLTLLMLVGTVFCNAFSVSAADSDVIAASDNDGADIYGDADGDKLITVNDATCVQKMVAGITSSSEQPKATVLDVDGDNLLSVTDATCIQKFIAGINSGTGSVGKPLTATGDNPLSFSAFYLADTLGWGSAYVYAWDDWGSEFYGSWPGVPVKETATDIYGEVAFYIEVPEGASGVIVSDGKGYQTEDITDFSVDCYWMDGSKNDLGHYRVKPISDEPVPEPEFKTLPVVNYTGWEELYIYAWDVEGNALCGEEPGTKVTETQLNEFGETEFIVKVPENFEGFILSDGKGHQTEPVLSSYGHIWVGYNSIDYNKTLDEYFLTTAFYCP